MVQNTSENGWVYAFNELVCMTFWKNELVCGFSDNELVYLYSMPFQKTN